MEIIDRETAQAWLRQQDRKTITAFAARNSLRAMSAIGGISTDRQLLPHFFVLRSTLTACVAATFAAPVTANKLAQAAQHAAETLDAELKATSLMDPSATRSAGRIALNAVQVASEHTTSVERSAETAFTWADNYVANSYAAANRDARLLTQIAENGQPASDVFNATLWPSPSENDHGAAEPLGHVTAYERVIASMDKEIAVWSFWQRWWEGMRTGDPLPWEVQERVALIGKDHGFKVWEEGPETVAEKIREIEEAYWVSALPQHEIIEQDPADGKFFVRAEEAEDTVESWLAQIEFALSLAVDSNTSDFNRMCTAFKYLDHTLTNCRCDPNAIEQQVGIARHIIDENIARSNYVSDDSLHALSRVLEQIQVQMRADHPEVRKAWEKRIAQKLREVDRDTKLRAAEAIRAETLRTKDRAEIEMRLDAETVESEQPVEAQAIALRRAGGRAAKMNAIERASEAVHDVDKSAGFKAVRIGTTGYTVGDIVWMLTDWLKG